MAIFMVPARACESDVSRPHPMLGLIGIFPIKSSQQTVMNQAVFCWSAAGSRRNDQFEAQWLFQRVLKGELLRGDA